MIQITKVYRIQGDSSIKAYVSVSLDDKLLLKNVKIIETKNGALFVALPSQKDKNDQWHNIIEFLDKESEKKFKETVLKSYKKQ